MTSSNTTLSDQVEEEIETQPILERQRPPAIESIVKSTKFNRQEIQYLYRLFKEFWPSGYIRLDQFQSLYSSIFPHGNSAPYAELVFRNIDRTGTGVVLFADFVTSFSKVSKGDINDKLEWIFNLYDTNCCGSIGYHDIFNVVRAIYQLFDSSICPNAITNISRQHVKLVFQKLDMKNDDRLRREDFSEKCLQNREIMESFEVFGTITRGFLHIS